MVERHLDGRHALRLPGGLRIGLHNLAAAALLLALTVLMACVSLATGATPIPLEDGWRVLRAGPAGASSGAPSAGAQAFAVWQVRLPRVLLAGMVGWCVAVTGAMLQSVSRNPLADPGMLGISQGATVALLVALVFAPASSAAVLATVAFAGALVVAGTLTVLTRGGAAGGLALVLTGIALESALASVTGILMLYAPAEASLSLSRWLAGSLDHATWHGALALAPWVFASLLVLPWIGRRLRSHELGDAMAMALGEDVRRSRLAVLLTAVLMTALTLPSVGPLMFLGVMAPHLAGGLSRATGAMRLLLSGLMGALLLICADALTRAAISAGTVPVGLGLVLIGVPLFLLVLRLRKLRGPAMS